MSDENKISVRDFGAIPDNEIFICIDQDDTVHQINGEDCFRVWLWGKNYTRYTFFKVEKGGLTKILPLTNLSEGQPYIKIQTFCEK